MARICAVGNEKGGEGKTLTVFQLSTMLAVCLQMKVLIVGFDPQMHIELLTGYNRAMLNARKSIFDTVRDSETYPIKNVIVPTFLDRRTYTYISQNKRKTAKQTVAEEDIIRGPDLAYINEEAMQTGSLTAQLGWALFLRRALEPIVEDYDYIFIDTNPTGGPLLGMALSAAQFVLMPLKPEELPVEGFKGIRKMIRQAREPSINPSLRIAGVFFNQTANWGLHKRYQQQVKTALEKEGLNDCPCFSTAIKHLMPIAESVSAHSPLALREPYSDAARYFWHLLQELLMVMGGPAVPRLHKYLSALEKVAEEQNAMSKKKKRYIPFLLQSFQQFVAESNTAAKGA